MDSFIDQDMEDEMVEDTSAPGSAVKKRKGLNSRALYASAGAQPQPPMQPGATLTGAHQPLLTCQKHCSQHLQHACLLS